MNTMRLIGRAYADLWSEALGAELTVRRRFRARWTILAVHISVIALLSAAYLASVFASSVWP